MSYQRDRRVTLAPGDPALERGSRSPVLGVSLRRVCEFAGVDDNQINVDVARGRLDITDWWDLARWAIERRMVHRHGRSWDEARATTDDLLRQIRVMIE